MTAPARRMFSVAVFALCMGGCGHQMYHVDVDRNCEATVTHSGAEAVITVDSECAVRIEPKGESNGNLE